MLIIRNRGPRLKLESGIFDILGQIIASQTARNLMTTAGKTLVETGVKKVGDVAGKKIVNGVEDIITKIRHRNLPNESIAKLDKMIAPTENPNASLLDREMQSLLKISRDD